MTQDGEPTGSWSILPKPLGVWPRFRFSLRVSLGKISSSCISSAIRAQPPGRRSRRRSDAGRVRSRRCAPLRRCRLVDRESRLRAARSDLSAPYQRVHYEDVARAHRVMQCAICLPRFSQEWRGRPMELTRGTSSMATGCAGAIYRLARSGKTRDGNAVMPGGVRVIVSLLTAPLRWRYGYVRGKAHAARVDRA